MISHNFFENGTKLKLASEINPPLKAMTRFVEDLGTLLDNVLQALIVSKNVVNIIIFHILMKKPTKISSPVEFQISLVNLKPTHIIVILVTK